VAELTACWVKENAPETIARGAMTVGRVAKATNRPPVKRRLPIESHVASRRLALKQ
jgi:hypothetical protein